MVFCGESIITEISVYVSFYMSEFIIQSTLLNRKPVLRFFYLDKSPLPLYNLKQIINVVDERNEYIRLWQLQRADGSESSAQTGG